jgi:hypothetical protein
MVMLNYDNHQMVQRQRLKTNEMLRLAVLTMLVSVASGARSWVTLIDPQVFVVDDVGRSANALMESDPLFTRSTLRPTSSPTITPEPTS